MNRNATASLARLEPTKNCTYSQFSLYAVAGTADWLLGFHPGLTESPCTKETPCLKCRFMAHARRVIVLRDGLVSSDDKRATFIKSAGIAPPNLSPSPKA